VDLPLAPDGSLGPPGTWSTTGAVPAGGTCIPARPGSFATGPGATTEEVCAPGSYTADFGSEACVLAPAGTFVAFSGAVEPEPCETALEAGATTCDTALAIAAPPSGSAGGPPVLLLLGIALALAGGVVGLVLLQRQDPTRFAGILGGALGATRGARGVTRSAGPGPSASPPSTPSASTGPGVSVLEWDEAFDEDPPVPPTASR